MQRQKKERHISIRVFSNENIINENVPYLYFKLNFSKACLFSPYPLSNVTNFHYVLCHHVGD